jgi:Na+/proline symporter
LYFARELIFVSWIISIVFVFATQAHFSGSRFRTVPITRRSLKCSLPVRATGTLFCCVFNVCELFLFFFAYFFFTFILNSSNRPSFTSQQTPARDKFMTQNTSYDTLIDVREDKNDMTKNTKMQQNINRLTDKIVCAVV